MGTLRGKDGRKIPYTRIPNEVIRNTDLDVYDKAVFGVIASCNPAYPSYETIRKWTGLSTDRTWKSLKKLEEHGLIFRYPRGRSIEYVTYSDWHSASFNARKAEEGGQRLRYTESSSPEPLRQTETYSPPHGEVEPSYPQAAEDLSTSDTGSLRHTEGTSPPHGDEPLRPAETKKTKEKHQIKIGLKTETRKPQTGAALKAVGVPQEILDLNEKLKRQRLEHGRDPATGNEPWNKAKGRA